MIRCFLFAMLETPKEMLVSVVTIGKFIVRYIRALAQK
jgi:hypothetical protein